MAVPIDLEYPFTGRWLVQNSPANRVPSHGKSSFASSFAIDFVPVDEGARTAPLKLASLLRPEPPEGFPGFGRPILSPVEGIVLATHDDQGDHVAHRGLPSIAYALTQGSRVRGGWGALAGNHVLIRSDGPDEVVVALCHLRHGSTTAEPGQRVHVGDQLGRCGNTGNSTEPHLHIQAMDGPDVEHATAVPVTFRGSLPRNGDVVDADGTPPDGPGPHGPGPHGPAPDGPSPDGPGPRGPSPHGAQPSG